MVFRPTQAPAIAARVRYTDGKSGRKSPGYIHNCDIPQKH